MRLLTNSKMVFVVASLLLSHHALATTISKAQTVKSTEAIVTDMQIVESNNARFTLDFVAIVDSYADGEYERYLKLGYPKISKEAFIETGSGSGFALLNHNKKLRTLTTHKNTIFKAHCTSSPHADESGQVQVTAQEFSYVFDKDNATTSQWDIFHKKHHDCYSQRGTMVRITYSDTIINTIEFVWMP